MNTLDHRHSDEWKSREHSIFQTMSEIAGRERAHQRRLVLFCSFFCLIVGFLIGLTWR